MCELISIIMPAYKCKETILQAVQSVISQSYESWELIVINDKCPYDSYSIIGTNLDTRIKVLHHEVNQGVAQARNTGIEYASGDYLAFLDADDYWHPEKLNKQIKILGTQADVVFSDYYREGTKRKRVRTPEKVTYHDLLKTNSIGNLTGMYNASKLGKFYQKSIGHEDYLMWLEVIKKSGFALSVQEALATYRVHHESLSGDKFTTAMWQWRIYRNELEFDFLQSMYYFSCYVFHAFSKRL